MKTHTMCGVRFTLQKKEYNEAISDFSQVIRYNSENISAYRNRGMCYYEIKNYEAALTDFEKLLQLNPNYKEIEDIKRKILNLIEYREKRESEEMKNKIAIFLMGIAMLFTIFFYIADIYGRLDSKAASKTESSKIKKSTALEQSSRNKSIETSLNDDEKIFTHESSETSLDSVEIGMKTTELVSMKGGAKKQDEWLFPGYIAYDYGNVTAVVKGDRVCAIFTNLPATATKKGIHPGSSDQELKNAYGSTSINYFNNRLYEFTSIDGQKCFVGFVVSNGAVIGIKITVKDVYDFWAAYDSLTKFNELITKRDYDLAYDYFLTENMKNQLGNYDNWRAGYRTTVKSEIKRINSVKKVGDAVEIAYDLEATDNPGGTRYFTGRALIQKNGGWWAIDNMINK